MNILIVKLSSLGDVVHAMPAVQDIRFAMPHARIDWVVERAYMPLVERCEGVGRAIPFDLRAWRRHPLSTSTRTQWRTFRAALRGVAYDAVIDLQGLTKSAVVSRMAQFAAGGHRYALGNRTEGAGWEAPTRWLADRPIRIEPHVHVVQRSRELCALALAYDVPSSMSFGLAEHVQPRSSASRTVALLHGSSSADREWSLANWTQIGRRLLAAGWNIALAQGNQEEAARNAEIASALGGGSDPPRVECWPDMPVDALAERLAGCDGVIGLDSGPGHLAVALGLPLVLVYRHANVWRTGPLGHPRQSCVEDEAGTAVDAVWQAWLRVAADDPARA